VDLTVVGSVARQVPEFPQLFIVENDPLERLLFDRSLIGRSFKQRCLEASTRFMRHLEQEVRADPALSELVLLSKGLVYQLGTAYEAVVESELPMNLVATQRTDVLADEAKVAIPYTRFDAGGSNLIIGDTIASGASVTAALDAYRVVHAVHRLYVLSYAGSLIGARRIIKYCEEARIEVTLLYGLAVFGLGDNGFDLSFLHPDTITRSEYRGRARQQFHGHEVSAVGWDFGAQCLAPRKYRQLCWLEAERWGLHGDESFAVELQPDSLDALSQEVAAFGSDLELPPL
jgi:hypothetical protein